jgi:intron-binding protein aquarius
MVRAMPRQRFAGTSFSWLFLFEFQNPEDNFNRLKRWIMIGDHHQLPPVIKNMAFQKFSNMEQSLFTRFVRLGVPTVDLDAQGRARGR